MRPGRRACRGLKFGRLIGNAPCLIQDVIKSCLVLRFWSSRAEMAIRSCRAGKCALLSDGLQLRGPLLGNPIRCLVASQLHQCYPSP